MVHGMQPYNITGALLCPMLDARRMEVYCLLADAQGHLLLPTHPRVMEDHSFEEWLTKHAIIFFGNGVAKCKLLLSHTRRAWCVEACYPTAQHVGTLASLKFQQAAFEEIASFEPTYLKPFQGKPPKVQASIPLLRRS